MRILICIRRFNIGGFSTFTINLSREFKKLGHITYVIATEPYGFLYEDFEKSCDMVIIHPRGLQRIKPYLKSLASKVEELSPDIIINNAVPQIQSIFPILSNKILKYTVLHNVVDDEVRICLHNLDYVNKIICVSENCMKKIIATNILCKEKVTVIPVGIRNIEPRKKEWCAPISLIYIGRMDNRQKNIGAIIPILIKLKKEDVLFEMHFIGSGPFLATLKRLISKNKLESYCKVYGAISPFDVNKYLYKADIFLMTSFFEGTPHTLLEAMGAGVIPIVSHIPGSTDKIIENRITGFLCQANNTDQYVSAITDLINDLELRESIVLNSKNFIDSNYSMNNIAKKYITNFKLNDKNKAPIHELFIGTFERVYCFTLLRFTRTMLGNLKRNLVNGVKPIKYNKKAKSQTMTF